jgi:hypothetical protein
LTHANRPATSPGNTVVIRSQQRGVEANQNSLNFIDQHRPTLPRVADRQPVSVESAGLPAPSGPAITLVGILHDWRSATVYRK